MIVSRTLLLTVVTTVCLLLTDAIPSRAQFTTYNVNDFPSAQAAVNQACTTGGSVLFPATYTLSTTLIVACTTDTKRTVLLRGSPTALTCQTGASQCVRFGNMPSVQLAVTGYGMENFRIYGPGYTTVGSTGLRIQGRAFGGSVRDVEIRNFDVGLSYYGGTDSGYLFDWQFDNLRIGAQDNVQGIDPNVDLAVELFGEVTAVFHHANLAGRERVIRMYGPPGSGSNVEFTDARMNQSNIVPGDAGGIWVQSGNLAIKSGDIEGAYPQFTLNQGALFIHDTTFTGDPRNSGSNPLISVPGSGPWYLLIDNSLLMGPTCCGGSLGPVIKIYDPLAYGITRITDSIFFNNSPAVIDLDNALGETLINGNTVTGGGVHVVNSKNVSITSNSIFNAANNAVRITGNSRNVVVDSNRIYRWNGSGADFPAIEVANNGTQSRISIRNNQIADPLVSATRAIYCGNQSPRPDIQVTMNSVSGLVVDGYCLRVKNK
jgi:hypothetical protein